MYTSEFLGNCFHPAIQKSEMKRLKFGAVCLVLALSFGIAPIVRGQSAPEAIHVVDQEFAAVGGGSVGSLHIYGYADDCQVQFAGFQYVRHSFGHIGPVRVDYMSEVIPQLRLREPAAYDQYNNPATKAERTIDGWDVVPAGARLFLFPKARLNPYFVGAGGVAYFRSPILSPEGTKLNFSAEFGMGFQYEASERLGIRVGYSAFHLSNGDTGQHNPALDNNFIYGGVAYRFKSLKQKR
jgi:opacity protein-like surface antigen